MERTYRGNSETVENYDEFAAHILGLTLIEHGEEHLESGDLESDSAAELIPNNLEEDCSKVLDNGYNLNAETLYSAYESAKSQFDKEGEELGSEIKSCSTDKLIEKYEDQATNVMNKARIIVGSDSFKQQFNV